MKNPEKNGWYLAYDMEWDRCLFKNGKWISQNKTRYRGKMTDVMIRDDITQHVIDWMELPDGPEGK